VSSVAGGFFLPHRFGGGEEATSSTGFHALPVVPDTIVLSAVFPFLDGGSLDDDVVEPEELDDREPNFPIVSNDWETVTHGEMSDCRH
jgi:hypothetical protein